mmetsp:Transcript_13154/g.27840  ORF Transcript_13154/g.27840 Transcript_13154/m.27840 type:complete len:80 (-) Transcript_13154:46-285(-)
MSSASSLISSQQLQQTPAHHSDRDVFAAAFGGTPTGPNQEASPNFSITASITTNGTSTTIAAATTTNAAAGSNDAPMKW